jgi:hypothetical protein
MKVMVIVKATPSSEEGILPTPELLAAMTKYNEELVSAGIFISAEGLRPSSQGVRVRFSDSLRTVDAGPFAPVSDLAAGFWLWEVRSLEEAIEWVKRCPNPMPEDSDIEIRPLYEREDFVRSDPTGEVLLTERKLREQVEQRKPDPASD